MASGCVITRVWGIPIKLHLTLLLVFPLFLLQMTGIGLTFFGALLTVILLFTSVALHELGHSRAAIYYGYSVREILLLPIGGVAMLEQLPRRPVEEFVIAIAGPAVSLSLAVAAMILSAISAQLGLTQFSYILTLAMIVNFMLCLFNLIPAFPMDGGRIFRAFMTPKLGRLRATYLAAKFGRFMAAIFGFGALFIIRPFSWTLLLIAVFLYYAAGAEYKGLLLQERFRQGAWFGERPNSGAPSSSGHEFSAGPAPYAREKHMPGSNRFRKWYDDLFKNYDS